jgi:hypothetical protein
MQVKNKEQFYGQLFVFANIILVFSIIIFFIYLVAPLMGGKLSMRALMHYGSWILLALGFRVITQRGRKGLWIRAYEYVFLCIAGILYFSLWSYPLNIFLSMLCIIGIAISYNAQNRRMKAGK